MYITTTDETYQDGQIIFEEGSYGDWIYIIEAGSVELSKKVRDKKVIIDMLEEGDVFGELGYIAKVPRTATARALGETTVGILDREFLDGELNKLSSSFQTILKTLALRLEKTTRVASETVIRRKELRIPEVLDLHFKNRQERIKAYSENISEGGIFIKTKEPLLQYERFTLNLFLPDDPEPLKAECEVSWNRFVTEDSKTGSSGMGVKFIQISQNDLNKLKRVLKAGK